MRAYERFLQYVQVDTTSDPANAGVVQPSTQKQFDLANALVKEMKQIGLADVRVDEKCYVYGFLPATPGCEGAPALGLVAHMDTAPNTSGTGVKPVLHKNYNGGDVTLPNGRVIPVATFPALAKLAGETLIIASGDTLLGADDKAGIAEILTACETLQQSGAAHGRICVAFTPDEEVGAGADGFDVPAFGADFAYTVDGSEVGEIEYETFNAAGAKITFTGVGVHPGHAKGIMVNATTLAVEFASMLPQQEVPEHTEGREGFYHMTDLGGNSEQAWLEYIVRDHDREKFEVRKAFMQKCVRDMQAKYGEDAVFLKMEDNYYNMGEVIRENFHLVENAEAAIRKAGLVPISNPVRGGTDGSRLSFMGLPCPNLGTGGFYFHGPNECITAERMDKSVEVLLNIIAIYAKA